MTDQPETVADLLSARRDEKLAETLRSMGVNIRSVEDYDGFREFRDLVEHLRDAKKRDEKRAERWAQGFRSVIVAAVLGFGGWAGSELLKMIHWGAR